MTESVMNDGIEALNVPISIFRDTDGSVAWPHFRSDGTSFNYAGSEYELVIVDWDGGVVIERNSVDHASLSVQSITIAELINGEWVERIVPAVVWEYDQDESLTIPLCTKANYELKRLIAGKRELAAWGTMTGIGGIEVDG
ncbi:MAG: hypothetical protein AB7P16_23445 [Bradyrhizobium sp.]|uniref:hypothetical protein n=1 Tax=Bradyrhizobium sp. TaxID=376 RepID=UPI003D0C6697